MITKTVSQRIPILINEEEIKGTITFEGVLYSQNMVLTFNYSNPLPFIVDDDDSISG